MDEQELLRSYRPWLRAVAPCMCGGGLRGRDEELAAEGWVAMWLAYRSHDPDKAPADFWLKHKALDRMRTVVRDWTAQQRDPNKLTLMADIEDMWDVEAKAFDLDWAYHHGEVLQALNALTPREREYVYVRFWLGWQKPELISHFGYEPSGLWTSGKRKLRSSLAHLATV